MTLFRMMFVFSLGYYFGHNNITPDKLFNNNTNEKIQNPFNNVENAVNSGINVMGVPLITLEKDKDGKVPSFLIMNTLRVGVVKNDKVK